MIILNRPAAGYIFMIILNGPAAGYIFMDNHNRPRAGMFSGSDTGYIIICGQVSDSTE